MKRISAIILSSVLALTLLAACGRREETVSPTPAVTAAPTPIITEVPSDDIMPDAEDGVVKDGDGLIEDGEEIIDDITGDDKHNDAGNGSGEENKNKAEATEKPAG